MHFYDSKITRCVYCGAKPLTMEHVLPKWLTKMPVFADVIADQDRASRQPYYLKKYPVDANGSITDVELVERGRRPRVNQIEVRAVCGPNCNRGWMSLLEVAVAPILTQLINDSTDQMTVAEMRLIQRWACKTAMMFEFSEKNSRSFSAAQYSEAYLKRGMVRDAIVSIARFNGSLKLGITHTGSRVVKDKALMKYQGRVRPADHARIGVTVITLGHIALMVHSSSSREYLSLALAKSRFSREIWNPMYSEMFENPNEPEKILSQLQADDEEVRKAALFIR